MAMCDSVTVSMAALIMGMFSRMLREIWVCVLVLAGTTAECAGRSNTSSKVRASGTGKWIIGFGLIFYCREGVSIKQMQVVGTVPVAILIGSVVGIANVSATVNI